MKHFVLLCSLASAWATVGFAQEVPSLAGWQIAMPTPESHRACVDLSAPRTGKGSGKIVGTASEGNARGGFIRDFHEKTAIKPGRTYRYEVSYRTSMANGGTASISVDSYAKEGEKSRKQLLSRKLEPSASWQTVSGEVAVPEQMSRVRLLLYLRGPGTVWYDDAFFCEQAKDSPNLLPNGGFEPPGSSVYELAPEKGNGEVKLSGDFDNGTLGLVKEIGPDEFYARAFPDGKPHSSFLWFHFRVDGAAGREVTFHISPAPFTRETTSGNGTRLPVVSEDGDHWAGIENKTWNEDGTVLTFKHRFQRSPAWVASFFPFTDGHIGRLIDEFKTSRHFKASTIGKTNGGRDMRLFTITDSSVPESGKREVLFTTLHHDLETTGAMAVEGICRFLLSEDPRADRLRRGFVFRVVPVMDPDGIAQGNLYCPVGNLNRQWGLGTTPETTNVERFVRELGGRGRTIDLFMDFHGWCTPERKTVFMTFGKEIADETSEKDALRLAETIEPKLSGSVTKSVWRRRLETVTGITGDLNRLSCGWMRFEAGARLAYSIEIFGEGECTQPGYLDWGRAFAEGIAEFYGCGSR